MNFYDIKGLRTANDCNFLIAQQDITCNSVSKAVSALETSGQVRRTVSPRGVSLCSSPRIAGQSEAIAEHNGYLGECCTEDTRPETCVILAAELTPASSERPWRRKQSGLQTYSGDFSSASFLPSCITIRQLVSMLESKYCHRGGYLAIVTFPAEEPPTQEASAGQKNCSSSATLSPAIRIFGVFLVLLDVTLLLADLIFNGSKLYIPLVYRSISLAIALFFLMDVVLRVFVEGRQQYFSDLFNVLDTTIIMTPLLVDVVYIFFDIKFLRNIPRWIHLVRLLRLIILIRIFHLIHQKRQLEKLMRRLVSENKRRYTRDGFDLDLTYVTERIIAMSFPSSGRQSFYRNPIEEVVRFLDKKHPNHYRVYNLCSERAYDPKYFHNRVGRIMIDDHNVPTLHEMVVFTKEVNEWMAQDPENIVAIHCKGGKGRTGTMICAFLIASEIFLTAEESLYYFGERRTDKTNSSKFQGVETPSQILPDIETDRVLIDVFNGPPLYDDVKVQFFSSNLPKYYDNCPFFFWFNTSFIQSNRLYLPRNELDNPHKQKTWKIYPPQFAVEVLFGEK
ncbi:hypothetical protein H8959_013939 [Pygathrix nigripes]